MSDEYKGVDDPWRRNTKDDAEKKETGTGLPGSEHMLDWDIMPDIWYALRVPGAYGALVIHGVKTMEGAATLFLTHIENSELLRTTLRQGGFRFCNTDDELPSGYVLHTPDHQKALYNPDISPVDTKRCMRNGFSQLVKTLMRACRQDPTFRNFLKKLGVEPLLS